MTTVEGRADVLSHVEKILGITRFEHTAAALGSTAPIIAVVGGRRSGKTFASQVAAIMCVFARRNAQVLVTGPNADSIRRWVGECAALLGRSELARGSTVDVEAMRITFSNSSEIIGLPPTPGRLRGYGSRVWMIVVDEAGYCPGTVWSDVRYCMLDHQAEGAQAWLIGSPWGGDEHFFKQTWALGVDGDNDVASFQWRADQNPLLPPGWLARERDRINAVEAAGELDGEWVSDGAQFFPRALLDRSVADIEVPELRKLYGPARGIVSCDWGVSFDRSAAVCVFRTAVESLNGPRPARPVFAVLPYVWAERAPLTDVVDAIAGCPSPFQYIASETNGVGAMPSQELQRRIRSRSVGKLFWNLAATTTAKKLAAYGTIRWLLERDQLVLPRDPLLLRQLAGLRLNLGHRGGAIEAETAAVHDDVADALALAALPYQPGAGRVICGLANLAGPGAPRDAPVGDLALPVVETGAGLRIYAKPPLQSVSGIQVTLARTRTGSASQ